MRLTRILIALALLFGVGGWLLEPLTQGSAALAQREPGINGTVTDYATGRPVPAASVLVRGTTVGTQTDQQGRYQLRVPPGEYEVAVSADGYIAMSRVAQRVDTIAPTRVDFEMIPAAPTPEQSAEIEARFQRERENLGQQPLPAPAPGAPNADLALKADFAPVDREQSPDFASLPPTLSVPISITVLLSTSPVVTKTMDFEEYLKGVVPAEMPPLWPPEALKAQAVAARSYAATVNRYPQYGAQVGITTATQAWSDKRYVTTDAAVEATRGVVATYNGRIAHTMYFAACREDRTFDNEAVFGGSPIDYLRSVVCFHQSDALRGHGVGLCQYGAKGMADAPRSANYAEIIAHFYRNVRLMNAGPPPAPRLHFPAPASAVPAASDVFVGWYPNGGEYNAVIIDANNTVITELPWADTTIWQVGRIPLGRYTWRVRTRFEGQLVGDWSAPGSFVVADMPYRQYLPLIARQAGP